MGLADISSTSQTTTITATTSCIHLPLFLLLQCHLFRRTIQDTGKIPYNYSLRTTMRVASATTARTINGNNSNYYSNSNISISSNNNFNINRCISSKR